MELAGCKTLGNGSFFVSWAQIAPIDQPEHPGSGKSTPIIRRHSASYSQLGDAALPFWRAALCLINAAAATHSSATRRRSDGPDTRLRPPFDDEPGRELGRQRARDGVVLWDCCLGVVEGSKALQRADRRDIGDTARSVRVGRFVLLAVHGNT